MKQNFVFKVVYKFARPQKYVHNKLRMCIYHKLAANKIKKIADTVLVLDLPTESFDIKKQKYINNRDENIRLNKWTFRAIGLCEWMLENKIDFSEQNMKGYLLQYIGNILPFEKASYAPRKKSHLLYIISCVEFPDWYKVGIAHNAKSRLNEMLTGNPCELYIRNLFQVEGSTLINSRKLESLIQKRFAKNVIQRNGRNTECYRMNQKTYYALLDFITSYGEIQQIDMEKTG